MTRTFLRVSTKTINDLIGSEIIFVQDNQSRSKRYLRGMHYKPSMDKGLIREFLENLDAVVDLRQSSKTWSVVGVTLSEKTRS